LDVRWPKTHLGEDDSRIMDRIIGRRPWKLGTVTTAAGGPLAMEVGHRRCRIMDDGNVSFARRIALNRQLLGISSRSDLIDFVRLTHRWD
jgi:hypothetical protein